MLISQSSIAFHVWTLQSPTLKTFFPSTYKTVVALRQLALGSFLFFVDKQKDNHRWLFLSQPWAGTEKKLATC